MFGFALIPVFSVETDVIIVVAVTVVSTGGSGFPATL